MIPLAGRQSGAVLIVALIMLIIITLTGISTAALIKDNTQVIQNFEARASVKSAALSGLQQAIARGTLLSSGVVFASPCTTSRTTCIDANGDGTLVVGQDILVTVSAVSCILTVEKSKADLDPFASAADESCITLVSQTDGTRPRMSVLRLCGKLMRCPRTRSRVAALRFAKAWRPHRRLLTSLMCVQRREPRGTYET